MCHYKCINMKIISAVALLLVLILPASTQASEEENAYERVMRTGVLRCGYFVWPPYMDKDMVTEEHGGIYYEIIESLGKALNIKIEWSHEYVLGQQIEALKTGKADALCADGPWTRSAVPFLDYTTSYMFIPGYIYVAEKNRDILTLEALDSPEYTFSAMDGDGSSDYLEMLFPKAKVLSIPSVADPGLTVRNVTSGKADAVFSDPMTVKSFSANNPEKLVILSPEKPLASYPFVISLPKGEQELLNMLNQGIDILNNTGMIAKILKEHDPSGESLLNPAKLYETP